LQLLEEEYGRVKTERQGLEIELARRGLLAAAFDSDMCHPIMRSANAAESILRLQARCVQQPEGMKQGNEITLRTQGENMQNMETNTAGRGSVVPQLTTGTMLAGTRARTHTHNRGKNQRMETVARNMEATAGFHVNEVSKLLSGLVIDESIRRVPHVVAPSQMSLCL
jgi:hypothetical protein